MERDPDPEQANEELIAIYESRLKVLYDARAVFRRARSPDTLEATKGQEVEYIDVIRQVVPPGGMPIRELRVIMRQSQACKSSRKGMVDLSIRTLEDTGSIVIRNERVYLPEHDPTPGRKSQRLPKEWYQALEPKI